MKKDIDLSGSWELSCNQMASGSIEQLELPGDIMYSHSVMIPGCLQGQGIGDEVSRDTNWVQSLYDKQWYLREEYMFAQEDKVRVPFLSQPPKTYRGKAWYKKKLFIEQKLDYTLSIECTKWKTCAWIDGRLAGEYRSLCVPHVFSLGMLDAGEHELVIGIDNGWQLPYRPDGHGVSDALGATWNGMSGAVILTGKSEISFQKIKAIPDLESNTVHFDITLENKFSKEMTVNIQCNLSFTKQNITESSSFEVNLVPGKSRHMLSCCLTKKVDAWDEFCPNLAVAVFQMETLHGNGTSASMCSDSEKITFGFVKAETKDGCFIINDRKSYLRGTHIGGEFPLTGYTDCSFEYWNKIMVTIREWGLNFIRFHSFCPPRAAFEAADLAGVYLQVECGMWNIFSKENPMNQVLQEEARAILDNFGNHPSFLCLSPSNEPGGDWDLPLQDWVAWCKEYDSRKLYTMQSGWPYPYPPDQIHGQDYVYFHRSGFGVEPGGTIRGPKGWNGEDYRISVKGIKYPVICHELGQWCSYPDFDIVNKFTGFMEPGNYEVFKASAISHGVYENNKEFAYCSGMLQTAMYKEDLEANFRTPHVYGFELLDLHDYLGQGTALIGVLDAFWDKKAGTDKVLWNKFCHETVPLARLYKKVYTCGEKVSVPLEICHFGQNDITAQIEWKLFDKVSGTVCDTGTFSVMSIPIGKNIEIGMIKMSMPVSGASALQLTVSIHTGTKIAGENEWNLWCYPAIIDKWNGETKTIKAIGSCSERIIATRCWETAFSELKKGSRVLFAPPMSSLSYRCPPLKFTPVFWNSQMGPTWDRGMGLVIDQNHPALLDFPTEKYADWQWEEIMKDAGGFLTEALSGRAESIVTVIDEWNRNKRMTLLLEANVLKGKLLLCMAEPKNHASSRQLYKSLFRYIAGSEFAPKQDIDSFELRSLFFERDCMKRKNTKVKISDSATGDISQLRYPYTLEYSMEQEEEIRGICYLPRQNHREHAGDIREYEISCLEGNLWVPIYEGAFTTSFEPKTVYFTGSIKTKNVRFTALSGFEEKEGLCWEAKSDGWYQRKKRYLDEVILEPRISLLYGEATESEGFATDWSYQTEQEFTAEKSATREIDV